MQRVKSDINVSESEIEEISKETGVEEKYIKKSFELKRADDIYQKQNNIKRKKSTTTKKKLSNYKSKSKTCYSFIKKQLLNKHTIPNFATIKSVESPKYTNKIILHTKTEYPKLPTDEQDIMEKSFVFRLSSNKDLNKFNYILKHVGVKFPSELESKQIPTKPISTDSYNYNINNISYETHTPKNTILGQVKYKLYRFLMWSNCIERESKCITKKRWGDFDFNKNIFLLNSIFIIPLLLIQPKWTILTMISLFTVYILLTTVGFIYAIYELVAKKSSNRYYIKQKIMK